MKSRTFCPPSHQTDALDRIRRNVRVIVGKYAEEDVLNLIEDSRTEITEAHAELDSLEPYLSGEAPPPAFVEAIRAPKGSPRKVMLQLHGRNVRILLNPTGTVDPRRESELWRSFRSHLGERLS